MRSANRAAAPSQRVPHKPRPALLLPPATPPQLLQVQYVRGSPRMVSQPVKVHVQVVQPVRNDDCGHEHTLVRGEPGLLPRRLPAVAASTSSSAR